MPEFTIDQNFVFILLKIFFVIGAFFYLIYSGVVAKQIVVMKKTLITDFSSLITLLGLINLIMATVLLLAFILFL
ncbi:MAG: hypothetical protein XD95_0716 [Microgenomates bacterium 39_7]|nr:MAG: hypothetical protein XD95_0716 [Microgenomates bacterium 39_7]